MARRASASRSAPAEQCSVFAERRRGVIGFQFSLPEGPGAQPYESLEAEKAQKELEVAAAGTPTILRMFGKQPAAKPKEDPKEDPIEQAIKELEKLIKSNNLTGINETRHTAVLHFLRAQRGSKAGRSQTALTTAKGFNGGVYLAHCLSSWERSWLKTRTIPLSQRGVHKSLSSLFNDEELMLFVRQFVASEGEKITSNLLAKAVQEYVGAKAVGTRVEAALGSADGRAKTGIKGRTARS
jgi:hypothetical protein